MKNNANYRITFDRNTSLYKVSDRRDPQAIATFETQGEAMEFIEQESDT